MNFFKKPVLFLAFAILAVPTSGFGQYLFQVDPLFSYFKDLQRYELSGTYVLPFATFAGVTRVNSGNSFEGDSTGHRTQAGTGVGGSIGLSLPFKATGHISCWAASIALMGHMYSWTDLNETMGINGTYTPQTTSLGATTIQVALPIGVDWKAGCDAIKSKRLAFGTTMGVGVMPQVNLTSVDNVSNVDGHTAFGCTPYAKVEGAFFVGWCIKVRVMYTMGDITLIDVNKSIPNSTDGPFKVTSNGNLLLSLVLMPFSGGWYEHSWWTTRDTYNEHDRLN